MSEQIIPLVDLPAQYARLKTAIDVRLQAVLEHGQFILGPEAGELEAELARLAGVRHAVCVASGSDALLISLLADGIGPGDAVFVPSVTFVATAGAVAAAGATPIFCDVAPDTFNLDAGDLARRVACLPGHLRPRAIVPVDLFGLPADYAAIRAIADAHDLLVIADAAQSFGAAHNGVRVGGLAPVTATSFFPTKPLGAYGDGGAIFTDDDQRAERLRTIRVHGRGPTGIYERTGLNSRLDTMQAAILLAKLETFEADLARRTAIAARYDAALAGHVGIQARRPDAHSTFAVYAILCEGRERVRASLYENKITTGIYNEEPLHLLPAMRRFSEDIAPLPVSEHLCARLLALPIYPELDDATVDYICDALIDALAT